MRYLGDRHFSWVRRCRLLLPVTLVLVGVYLLIGCIPIPSTRQFQPDNTLRPEHLIGKGKPVEIGKTHIDDAFIELTRQVKSDVHAYLFSSNVSMIPERGRTSYWQVSADHHRFALNYKIRTATWLMPLCFQMYQQTESRWLTLEVNPDGVVTRATTTKHFPAEFRSAERNWLEVFDAPTRRKLYDSGIFPSDDQLERAQHEAASQRTATQHLFRKPTPTTR